MPEENIKICELCRQANATCAHYHLVSFIDSNLRSDNIEAWGRTIKQMQTFIESRLQPLIAHSALQLAELYFGKKGIIKWWKERMRCNKGEFTAEELADFEEQEAYEREKMMRDYTPPTDLASEEDNLDIAKWLVLAAEEGTFDDEFEQVMMRRYNKKILTTKNGQIDVMERIKSLADSEEILTEK